MKAVDEERERRKEEPNEKKSQARGGQRIAKQASEALTRESKASDGRR